MTHYWFVSTKHRQSSKLALLTFVLAFAVILLGAYTRLTDAGLSCPDWPHCYGFVTAPHTTEQLQNAAQKYPTTPVDVKKAWTEMTHRYFAGAEGILILILTFSIFRRKSKNLKSFWIATSLIALLCVQIMLGMLTVTEKLKPIIVLSHLLTGLSILSVLWWAYLDLHLRDNIFLVKKLNPKLLIWFWTAIIVVATQITLGGWVSTHSAGLACIDFPFCNGKLLPALNLNQLNTDLLTIHMLHRIGAYLTALYLGMFALFLLTKKSFKWIGWSIITLITLQITLGILNIIWLRPVWVALLHQSVAIFILLTVVTALIKAYLESMDARYGS